MAPKLADQAGLWRSPRPGHLTGVIDKTAMSPPASPPEPRRFYREALAVPTPEGFAIQLDGRQAKTPGGHPLILPKQALGDLVVSEWTAQGDSLDWGAMAATRLAAMAIEAGPAGRVRAVDTILGYGASDLVCYFATHPRSLMERQYQVWGALLDWARDAHGLAFVRASGVIHQAQPPGTLQRLEAMLGEADDFALSGLAFGAPLFGSAILALALAHGHLDAAAASAAARLDETFQEDLWGIDPESAKRAQALAADAAVLERWFMALA
jgi:chaperone required for assembly of F1-ATPase